MPQAKESAPWIHGLDGARAAWDTAAGERPGPRLIHLRDRAGDASEVRRAVAGAGEGALIRWAQDRRAGDPFATAHAAVRHQPVLSRTTVVVDRKAGVPHRGAWVEVRSLRVTLGRDFGPTVEVIAGLDENDAVILNPPDSLVDGEIVRVLEAKAGSEAEK